MKKFDVAIIGAGAAGIMAAITASKRGKSVVLIDKNKIIGRKILATGNGRCNLTNRLTEVTRYHGGNREFISGVLSNFDQFETMKFFEGLGLILREEDKGRIFPRTNQAGSVLEALSHELNRLCVAVKTEWEVEDVVYTNEWQIKSEGAVIRAEKLILATGGKAAHIFGSSGDGLYYAKKLGHRITEVHAALVPLETVDTWTRDVQGLKIEGMARVVAGGKILAEREGDILFTHYGLSGPAIMGLARTVAPLVERAQKVSIEIDAIPEESLESLDKIITSIFATSGAKALKNALSGVVPLNLAIVSLKNVGIDPDKKAAQLSKTDRLKLLKYLKAMSLAIKQSRPLKEAQVTAGGVDVAEIDSKTMGSKIVKNLYFAGEIVDVDGDSGGFNLQWAWSSGFTAGKGGV